MERKIMERSKFVQDIHDMHAKFGFHESVKDFDVEKLKVLLDFREKFQKEEYVEFSKATEEFDAEEIVDGLIDTIVVAIGTLDLFGVDVDKAWDEVHVKNMAKERGIKENRPNPLGMPDLMKPEGWTAPSHEGNHGTLSELAS